MTTLAEYLRSLLDYGDEKPEREWLDGEWRTGRKIAHVPWHTTWGRSVWRFEMELEEPGND